MGIDFVDRDPVKEAVEVVEEMTDDQMNRFVDWLRGEMKDRARRRNAKASLDVKMGSRVQFQGRFKPQYLEGLTGEVVETRQTRVVVKLDRGPFRKFKSGRVITSPSSLKVID